MKENDVIIVFQNKIPLNFAVVQSIVPDVKRGWWVLTIQPLILENSEGKLIPTVSWILRDAYLEGESEFTMNGIPMFLKVIDLSALKIEEIVEESPTITETKGNVSFVNFKKKILISTIEDEVA